MLALCWRGTSSFASLLSSATATPASATRRARLTARKTPRSYVTRYNPSMWLHRLDEADASCGGKAVGLARLIAAGLPVPDGFVIDGRAFRHVVGDLDPASDDIGHALTEAAQRIATAELPPE